MIFECVINISEGRDHRVIGEIALGNHVRNIHMDADHNRSVLTLASTKLDDVFVSAQRITSAALEKLSFSAHQGVHPRLGIVDVVPFISYSDNDVKPTAETIATAKDFGQWLDDLGTPIFFYDAASPDRTTLPSIRKYAFAQLPPSLSVQNQNPHTGATCVGARDPLIAINVNLDCRDVAWAQLIAQEIRESSGGLKGVRAIGLELYEQNRAQVSMNIVDVINVNVGDVCEKIRAIIKTRDHECDVELVGLVPEFQFLTWSKNFLAWSGLDNTCTVEYWITQ